MTTLSNALQDYASRSGNGRCGVHVCTRKVCKASFWSDAQANLFASTSSQEKSPTIPITSIHYVNPFLHPRSSRGPGKARFCEDQSAVRLSHRYRIAQNPDGTRGGFEADLLRVVT